MRHRQSAIAIVLGALLTTAVACGNDDPGESSKQVLPSNALPAIAKTTSNGQVPAVGWCAEVNTAQDHASTGNEPAAVGTDYQLENGDYVHAIVMGPAVGKSIEDVRSDLEEAIATCVAKATPERPFEATSGLPSGTWGYEAGEPGSSGVEVFTVTDGGNLLAVGVAHAGDGEPSVDVASLIKEAANRADDIVGS